MLKCAVLRFNNIPPLVLSLISINLFGHITLSGGRVVTSLYTLEAGGSEFLVGCLIGLFGLLPMALSLTMGRWVDRVGPFVPMRAGISAVVVGSALPAMMPQVATLFATAALCGLGFTIVTVAAQHTIGHLHQEGTSNRVALFGWLALGHSTSGILGPVIVGIAIDLAGYRAAFTVLAVSAAISLALVLKHGSKLRALHIDAPHTEQGNLWALIKKPAVRRVYLVGILVSIAWDLFTFMMPILGHRQRLSASSIGTILAAFAAGTFSVRLVMGRLAHHFTEWQILRAAIALIVVVYLALPLTPWPPIFFLLAFTLGAAVGCGQPNVLSLLHAAAPRGRGAEAVGFRSMLGNASGVLVPFLFGATAASVGLLPVFWGIAALVAVAVPAAHRAALSQSAKTR
ncbi:MAG: MFS transporter [Burkholderiales bacterium]|nr:MFS transporter [Burkholderiales bacterium]